MSWKFNFKTKNNNKINKINNKQIAIIHNKSIIYLLSVGMIILISLKKYNLQLEVSQQYSSSNKWILIH